MGRNEYDQARATKEFVEWAQRQPGVDNTDVMEENLPVLVDRYITSGGEIPVGTRGPLETVRMQLSILDSCFVADDGSFEDVLGRFEELLDQYRSVLPPEDRESTMKVDPRRGRMLFDPGYGEPDDEDCVFR